MSKFNATKPIKTRDGREATIWAHNPKANGGTIVALVKCFDGKDLFFIYYENGRVWLSGENDLDLINIPEYHSLWVNVYERGTVGAAYKLLETLRSNTTNPPVATLELIFSEQDLKEVKIHKDGVLHA